MADASEPDSSNLTPYLLRLIHGFQFTQALYVVARLRIPDLLADDPQPVAELAARSGSHAPSLDRVLRALITLDVFTEVEPGVFGLRPLGQLLRGDAPNSERAWLLHAGGYLYEHWGALLKSVQTGETASQLLHGKSAWEWRAQHPELNAVFNDAMVERSSGRVAAILAEYDFSRFGTIVDVGGGRGALLARVLRACRSARGVLFDLPHVVDGAAGIFAAAGVADRIRVIPGDFFAEVPAGGDAYILSVILHDWGDEPATAILRNCHQAMGERATLLLIERVLPAAITGDWGAYFGDLNMMQELNGRERTEEEWRALLTGAGFSLQRIVSTKAAQSVIEASPA